MNIRKKMDEKEQKQKIPLVLHEDALETDW
jgi:hypothetical protein